MDIRGAFYRIRKGLAPKKIPAATGTIDEMFVNNLGACTPEQRQYIGEWLRDNYCNIPGLDYTPISIPK